MSTVLTMEELLNASLLVIDDLGDCNETDFVVTQISELLDYRWRNNLATWISTNISK